VFVIMFVVMVGYGVVVFLVRAQTPRASTHTYTLAHTRTHSRARSPTRLHTPVRAHASTRTRTHPHTRALGITYQATPREPLASTLANTLWASCLQVGGEVCT
jgi:hypothetical protein